MDFEEAITVLGTWAAFPSFILTSLYCIARAICRSIKGAVKKMDKHKEFTKDELLELAFNMDETEKNELFKKDVLYTLAGIIGQGLCFIVYKTVNIDTSLKELLLLGAMIYCTLIVIKGMTYGLPIMLAEEAKLKKEENGNTAIDKDETH